ncbi:MAG: PPC domain-containing protein, partial [Bryobacteraceae bacterium]
MRFLTIALILAGVLRAAAPSIAELQPRGAQKGRPFTLTIVGQNLGEGPSVISDLPATFTAMRSAKPDMASRYATFLVEPTVEWAVGVYAVRVKGANGLSNVLLFSIGAFPEITEDESRAGALPHQNDSIETAQPLPSTSVTLNGTLQGPERDLYRIQVKAGERRVFEVDARRCGSAIDPVIQVMDGSGKLLARSDDDPLLSLDARVDITFAKEGTYYVEVHDARFSTQAQNFYRLKSGSYSYASEMFPLGGRRGEKVEVELSGTKVNVDLTGVKTPRVFVSAPDSPVLPLPFAVGEYPEIREPVTGALPLPVTVNGRLSAAGEIDKYELAVEPGADYFVDLQARELGSSKLTGLLNVLDDSGKKIASAGDGPLPVDVAAVQASSRTLGDPYVSFKAPGGVRHVWITVEDLARRGGPQYGYRLMVHRATSDFRASIGSSYLNIP